MAENQVEIDIVLTGAEDAVEGFESIGETSKAMAERFEKDNSKLGEGLGDLTGNVQEMVGSVKGLGQAFQMSGTSMMGMLPAIGAVVAAGFALYETFLNISGAAEEAERSEQAMAAAASDLQSKLEALAEKGVIPTAEELQKFTEMTVKAQFAKEQLQTSMEKKVTPAMENYNELLQEQRKLQRLINKDTGTAGAVYLEATKRLPELDKELAKARQTLTDKLKGYREEQQQVEEDIKAAAKQEQEFEERSTDARLARIKENKTRLDTLRLMEAETKETETQAKAYASLQKEKRALFDIELERAEEADNEEYIKKLDDQIKADLNAINQRRIIEQRGVKDRQDIRAAAREKEEAEQEKERSKRMARAAAFRAKQAAQERQHQAELRSIRELEYQQLELEGVTVEEILEMRYTEDLKQAKNNQNLKLIAEMKYQNALAKIQIDADEKKEARETRKRIEDEEHQRRQAEQRQAFIESTILFDTQRIEDETTRELGLLGLRYQKEFDLAQDSQEQITELQRRYSLERQDIEQKSIDAQIQQVGEFTNQYGAGLAEAAFASLVFGESFSESVGEILVALGRQASVQALMETAKGTAALFLNPTAAGNHFAAAGLFTGAAIAAGAAGKAMGGGGGAASGAAATSPTGTPQTTSAPQREEADTSSMVFNINFGGAVIYDTQRAAEQALADRITTLQNTRRRGAPRRSF